MKMKKNNQHFLLSTQVPSPAPTIPQGRDNVKHLQWLYNYTIDCGGSRWHANRMIDNDQAMIEVRNKKR